MNITHTHVNFEHLVSELKAKGAFTDYPEPLGKSDASALDPTFHNPAFPGDDCYGNGPAAIGRWEIDLPQDLITAQRDSNKDAIRLYMPEKHITEWMHEYFSSDFMASQAFRKLVNQLDFPAVWTWGNSTNALDASLSMKLDAPERNRNDRVMYTEMEMKLTAKICKEVPSLALTVIAYQASYIEYLGKLGAAIKASNLSLTEKERGAAVVAHLADNWEGDNFMGNILPAIAIHYYENHNRNIGEKPTEKDFTLGMKFAVEKGMFKNEVKAPDGNPRKFSCPAKGILTRMSAVPLGHETGGELSPETNVENAPHTKSMNVGIGLFHIYREIEKTLAKDSHAAMLAVQGIHSMIEKLQVAK